MTLRRRVRAVIRWSGAIITALLLIVGVGSGWYGGSVWFPPTIGLMAWGGQLRIIVDEPWSIQPRDFHWDEIAIRPTPPVFRWWFDQYRIPAIRARVIVHWCVPFWSLVLLTGVPTFLMFRADRRRATLGHCPTCDYNRTGLPSDRPCPECGATVQVTPRGG